ncbi:hypothetical protein [Niabella beijingensis]|nr:hypothetical protein [Niabella beijingensis]
MIRTLGSFRRTEHANEVLGAIGTLHSRHVINPISFAFRLS